MKSNNIDSGAWRALTWLVVAAIVCGIGFRLYHLDHKTFWEDEILGTVRMLGYTEAEIVQAGPHVRTAADIQTYFRLHGTGNSLSATIRSLAQEDPQHPPLYYLLVRIWVGRAGTSVLAQRLLPAIFGILAIGAMYLLARELFGNPRAAAIAAALYALSPFAVLYAQEAREYSLWTLQTLISSMLVLRAVRTGERRYWIGYGVCTALGLYVYPLTALVSVAHGAFVLAHQATRKMAVIVPFMLSAAAAALVFVPWLAMTHSSVGARGFAHMMAVKLSAGTVAVTFMRNLRTCVTDFGPVGGSLLRHAVTVSGAAVLALLAYSLWFLFVRDRQGGKVRSFVFALLIIPPLPLLGHDLLSPGTFVTQVRYFVPAYTAIALALAYLFHATAADGRRRGVPTTAWSAVFALVLTGGAVSCAISSQASTWYNKVWERSPAVAAEIAAAENPVVIGDLTTSRVLGLSFYLPPRTAMRFNLHCDVCDVPAAPPHDLLAAAGRFGKVFVLGTLPPGTSPGPLVPVSYVGVQILPPASAPLNMFGSPYP
jgi:uncharacterized membrane protein